MPGTGPCPPARFYLAPIRHKRPQLCRVFIIYFIDLVPAKDTYLTLRYVPRPTTSSASGFSRLYHANLNQATERSFTG